MVRASSVWRVLLLLLLGGFLFPRIASATATATKRLAVLEFVSSSLKDETLKAFSDALRGGAVEALNGRAIAVMTRENMVMLLKSMGRSECSEGECEVETARNIGADYVISGSVTIIEGTFVVTLKLHETQNGDLLGTDVVESKTQIEILRSLREHGRDLVGGKIGRARTAAPAGQERHIEASSDFAVGQVNQVVVKFDSAPSGATVIVDGVLLCKETPCSRQLAPGTHDIEMQKEGYEPAHTSLQAQKGAVVLLSLNANFATLIVQTTPSDLPYLVDGRRQETQDGVLALAPGQHEIVIDHECHLPTGEQVVVRKGERRELQLTAQPRVAGIEVSATDGAGNDIEGSVLVDGTDLGKTPGAFKVPLCSREIEVVATEGRYIGPLQLTEKQTTAIRAQVSGVGRPTERPPTTAAQTPGPSQKPAETESFKRLGEMGFRVGFARPMGNYDGFAKMSDLVSGAFPLEFGLGVHATPSVYVGAFVQLAIGVKGDKLVCNFSSKSDSCNSAELLRTGLDLRYRWPVVKNTFLWLGTGTGFAMLNASSDAGEFYAYGWEIAHLDLGLDYWTSKSFVVGPYLSWSIAEYLKWKSSPAAGDSTTGDIANPATHQWVALGLRFAWTKE